MAVGEKIVWGGRKKFARYKYNFSVSPKKKRSSPKIVSNFYKNDNSIVGSIWVELKGRKKDSMPK